MEIAVDLDGTLAEHYNDEVWSVEIGEPIPPMINKIKRHIDKGDKVIIFTARIWPVGTKDFAPEVRMKEAERQVELIQKWCVEHLGKKLEVSCVKRPSYHKIYDDKCIGVIKNTGQLVIA